MSASHPPESRSHSEVARSKPNRSTSPDWVGVRTPCVALGSPASPREGLGTGARNQAHFPQIGPFPDPRRFVRKAPRLLSHGVRTDRGTSPRSGCHAEGRGFESHHPLFVRMKYPANRRFLAVGESGSRCLSPRLSPWVRAATFCFHPEACYGAGLDRLTPARSGSAAGPVTWRGHAARVFTVTWRTAA